MEREPLKLSFKIDPILIRAALSSSSMNLDIISNQNFLILIYTCSMNFC